MDVNDYFLACESSSDEEYQDVDLINEYSSDESDTENNAEKFSKKFLENQLADPQNDLDPFESEMADELELDFRKIKQKTFGSTSSGATANNSTESSSSGAVKETSGKDSKNPQYDTIYFDSDEDMADDEVQSHRQTISDADLFYDPDMDDKDQEWCDSNRDAQRGHLQRSKNTKKEAQSSPNKKKKKSHTVDESNSDAVLNCPACLTQLSSDCQRHSIYGNQYRAMFVSNCVVDYTKSLQYSDKLSKKEQFKVRQKEKKALKQKQKLEQKLAKSVDSEPVAASQSKKIEDLIDNSQENVNKSGKEDASCSKKVQFNLPKEASDAPRVSLSSDDMYHPVSCSYCNTKVAVYDREEVYHFFNVVTSY